MTEKETDAGYWKSESREKTFLEIDTDGAIFYKGEVVAHLNGWGDVHDEFLVALVGSFRLWKALQEAKPETKGNDLAFNQ